MGWVFSLLSPCIIFTSSSRSFSIIIIIQETLSFTIHNIKSGTVRWSRWNVQNEEQVEEQRESYYIGNDEQIHKKIVPLAKSKLIVNKCLLIFLYKKNIIKSLKNYKSCIKIGRSYRNGTYTYSKSKLRNIL